LWQYAAKVIAPLVHTKRYNDEFTRGRIEQAHRNQGKPITELGVQREQSVSHRAEIFEISHLVFSIT